MRTIEDAERRAELKTRLATLRADAPARFGTLDAPRMLCHLEDQVRIALGEVDCRERKSLLRLAPLRWLVLRLPVPKGKLQTVREMRATEPQEFETDRARLVDALERLAAAQEVAPHPVFGALSPRVWKALTWKHFDHHLGQFGV